MASTHTLRQHNQNQARSEDIRNAKSLAHGATAVGSNPSKISCAAHASQQGAENKDPSTHNVKGTAECKHGGTSRLPVLVRSQPLQPQKDFTREHRKWEQTFQKGMAQKKPCTKPVPFSLSQPKASRAAKTSQRTTQPTDSGAPKPTCPTASQPPRPLPSCTAPPVKPPASGHKALPVTATHTTALPVSAPHTTHVPAHVPVATVLTGRFGLDDDQSSERAKSISGAQSGPLVPLQDAPLREASIQPAAPTNGVQFSPDPAALHSILQNEGVKSRGLMGAAPKSSACASGRGASVYMPQRVSILRTRPRPPAVSAVGAVHFSPDPAALGSILRNEGVNTEGPLGATPKGSTCPTARGTSVYMPRRVPVRKHHSEAAGVSAGAVVSQTPPVKWTPLRVPNTRPHSAMRHLSAHRNSLFRGSPTLRGLLRLGKELGPHKTEPVVQKLFEEAEQEEQSAADREEENVADGQQDQPASQEPKDIPFVSLNKARVEEGCERLVTEESGRARTFAPPPHRESVIVFSSAKKKIVAVASAQQSRPGPLESDSFPLLRLLPTPGNAAAAPPPEALPPPLPSLSGARAPLGGGIQWVPHLHCGGPAVRQRRPLLEECLLDEECAMFTSRPSTAPSHPRCTNPVATVLLMETSTCFVPIDPTPLSTMQDPIQFVQMPV